MTYTIINSTVSYDGTAITVLQDDVALATFYGEDAEKEATKYMERLKKLEVGLAIKAKFDAMTTPEKTAEYRAKKARRSPYGDQ